MSIAFNKENNLFHLSNDEMSFYVYLHPNGQVLCPYFGKRLSELAIDEINYLSPDWYSTYFSRESGCEKSYDNLWLNSTPFLASTDNAADTRPSVASIEGFDDDKLDFRYVSHRIYDGKPVLSDLPYSRDNGFSQTLELTLKDKYKEIFLVVSLTVFKGYNVIARNTKLVNRTGKALWLKRAMSLIHDFARSDWDLIHFPGEWCFERQFRRERLSEGTKVIASANGRSSHEHNPFVMLCEPCANETYGEVYACSIVYSGSFKCEAHVSKTGVTRLTMGIGDRFKYEVTNGGEFEFPEGITVYGKDGFESVSRQLHNFIRENIVRDGNAEAYGSILLNSWEGCYMDFDTDKLIDEIRSAAKIGVELFVLDDGWFGARNDDSKSLGDWFVNNQKVDLKRVIDECHVNNMRFGLWIEPEMGNMDSQLLREHPEYAAVNLDTDFWLSRHQVPLNFADDNVVCAIYKMIADILFNYDIDYVKWDHNRSLEDCRAANLDGAHKDEFYHRNIIGYYRLAKMLTNKFPDVHFQGCASGGGRFDLGTLFYFPEIWTSDENDPVQRLFIQYGTSFCYPPSVMGAHVNDNKITDYTTKAQIALFGSYGFELDPCNLKENDANELLAVNEIYRKYHKDVVLEGDLYRLISPFDNKAFAIDMVSKDGSKALFLYVNLLKQMRLRRFVKLRGLKADAYYTNSFDGKTYKGEYYMNVGLNLSFEMKEFYSCLVTLDEIIL